MLALPTLCSAQIPFRPSFPSARHGRCSLTPGRDRATAVLPPPLGQPQPYPKPQAKSQAKPERPSLVGVHRPDASGIEIGLSPE